MKIIVFLAIALLTSVPALAQTRSTTKSPSTTEREMHRDFKLEKTAFDRTERLKELLQPEVRVKLDLVTLEVLAHVVSGSETDDFYSLAQQKVRGKFARLSNEQSDLLTFYVLAKTARILKDPDKLKNSLDGLELGGISETMSLRLQMMVDRRARIIQTLSNILKKISTTSDSVIQNLK